LVGFCKPLIQSPDPPSWAVRRGGLLLVCFFTAYLEALAHRTPDPEIRRLVREILEEEYMRRETRGWP
jgi:hypothetical protein